MAEHSGYSGEGQVRRLDEVEELQRQLRAWREWAQFAFNGGGPVQGTDEELRAMVCDRSDGLIQELQALNADLTDRIAEATKVNQALAESAKVTSTNDPSRGD